MLKILLIDVGSPRDEINEPLGIENLAGKLYSELKGKVEVKQCFLQIEKIDISDLIDSDLPHIVAISTKIGNYRVTESIVSHCLNLKVQPLIVIGDILSTLLYEELLNQFDSLICVRGEGEDAFVGIVKAKLLYNNIKDLKSYLLLNDIPNLAFVQKNRIVRTNQKIVNLTTDFYPDRYFLQNILNNYGIIRAEASRGCPWNKCAFCYLNTKYNGQRWRPFSVQKVLTELIYLSKYDIQMVYYNDEDFIGDDPHRAEKIADLIIKNKNKGLIKSDLIFFISTSVRSVLGNNSDITRRQILLKKLIKAGFKEIFLGIESGSKSQLTRYNKGVSIEENKIAISLLLNLDANIDIGFIMFDHQMTVKDLKDNLCFIDDVGIVCNSSNLMKTMRVIPRTTLADKLHENEQIHTPVDIDELMYEVDFKDKKIELIHKYFTNWQNKIKPLAYSLQAESRGQLKKNQQRLQLRKKLGKIREVNYNFLKYCIAYAEKSKTLAELDAKLESLIKDYSKNILPPI